MREVELGLLRRAVDPRGARVAEARRRAARFRVVSGRLRLLLQDGAIGVGREARVGGADEGALALVLHAGDVFLRLRFGDGDPVLVEAVHARLLAALQLGECAERADQEQPHRLRTSSRRPVFASTSCHLIRSGEEKQRRVGLRKQCR